MDDIIRMRVGRDDRLKFTAELQLYAITDEKMAVRLDDMGYMCSLLIVEDGKSNQPISADGLTFIFNTDNINVGVNMLIQLHSGRTLEEAKAACKEAMGEDIVCNIFTRENVTVEELFGWSTNNYI